MWMAWGPELTFFCNAAYRRDTLGRKYPWALGRPASEVWAEIWDDIGPRIDTVLATGEATWDEALLLFLERSGYPEETLPHLLLQPAARRRRRAGRHALRGQRGHRAGHRRAADGHAARPRLRPERGPHRAGDAGVRQPAARPQPARPAVHPDLPVRRRRRAPGWRPPPASPPGTRPRPAMLPDGDRRSWPVGRRRPAASPRWSTSTAAASPTCRPATGRSRPRRRCWCRCCSRAARRTASWSPALNRYRAARRRLPRLRRAGRRARRRRDRQRPQLPGAAAAGRGAGRAGPGQDRVLLQHQPRVPHPADPDHGPGARSCAAGWPTPTTAVRAGAGRHPPQRAAAGQAGQHAARLLPHRGRPDAGPLRAGRPGRRHRRAGQRLPLRRRAGRPGLRGGLPAAARAGATSTAACGRRWSSTCSATR